MDDYFLVDNSPQTEPEQHPTSMKRKRSSELLLTPPLLTPPISHCGTESERVVSRAVNVVSTAATALSQISILYQSDHAASEGLVRAVEILTRVQEDKGKLLVCGVGKSGLVGQKTVATMKSLGLACSFLHASEALHGDLGDLRSNDAILFISYSGKTPELLHLLSHIPLSTPLLAISGHKHPSECLLLHNRPNAILLPAPIHESEEESFGVSAPTTSTTVAISVGDMLALTLADQIYQDDTKNVFQRNHPGGTIGANARRKSLAQSVEVPVAKRTRTETTALPPSPPKSGLGAE
ncbi:sugar isomerase [Westerdykella ornata]|uniref:Sugar isomerase n=1 Tax=Westerdykella ornata TaxID=318751 RepID=A0A6A6JGK2_WESOR|nr:sugar isomerase [Westerdykella ornata]KAF2275334.1 sugar isomerase [Westerdykella ornata]